MGGMRVLLAALLLCACASPALALKGYMARAACGPLLAARCLYDPMDRNIMRTRAGCARLVRLLAAESRDRAPQYQCVEVR